MRTHHTTKRFHPRLRVTRKEPISEIEQTAISEPMISDTEIHGTGLRPVGNLISELRNISIKPRKKVARRKYIF